MIPEIKYLVIKTDDINKHLDDSDRSMLSGIVDKIQAGRSAELKTDQQYVCIASDWPIYDAVWSMLEAYVDGTQVADQLDDSTMDNFQSDDILNARPAQFFAFPPYRPELFSKASGWSGVMNAQGINVLTFINKPGAVVTDFETAKLIADKWNRGSEMTGQPN